MNIFSFISKHLMSVFLTVILLFAAIFVGSLINSDAKESQYKNLATPMDSSYDMAVLMEYEDGIFNKGTAIYDGTTTDEYIVRYNGEEYEAWCGDHSLKYVTNTSDFSVVRINNSMIRKALFYGYSSPFAWSGFNGMSKNQRIVVMALTMDYIRHEGTLRKCCEDYYNYISKKPDINLNSSETGLCIQNIETKEEYEDRCVLRGYYVYDDKTTNTKRKRTDHIKLKGNSKNYISIIVPSKCYLHVKEKGADSFTLFKKGEHKVYCGSELFFSTELTTNDRMVLDSMEGCVGITAYGADSKASGDQTLIFSGAAAADVVDISIEWETPKGYIWMSKNNIYSSDKLSYTSAYNINAYYNYSRNKAYNMAGITYFVYDNDGKVAGRFISSYNGLFYQDKENGNRLIFKSPEEYNSYGADKIMQQYIEVPFGTYRISESQYLWTVDSNNNETVTKNNVKSTGFYHNTGMITIEVDEGNMSRKRSVAAYAQGYDRPVTGSVRLNKSDSSNRSPLSNAEYVVYDKDNKAIGTFVSDADGIGIVKETIYDGKGTDTISGIPIGSYIIIETKSPSGYLVNNNNAILTVSWDKITLYSNGETMEYDTTAEVVYEAVDDEANGYFSFVKKDAITKEAIANVRFLLEDETGRIKVAIYTDENGYYSSKEDNSVGALPSGRYYLTELRCEANIGRYKLIDTITFDIPNDSDGDMVVLEDIYNYELPTIKTSAVESTSGDRVYCGDDPYITIVDTVYLTKLDIGHEYTVDGVIMDKATNDKLIINNETYTASMTFVADSENMSVDISYTIPNDNLKGKSLVVFEYLRDKEFYEDEIIASHEDMEDKNQTIRIVEISTETTTESTTETTTEVTTEVTTDEETELVTRVDDVSTEDNSEKAPYPEKREKTDSPSTGDGVPLFIMIAVFLIALTAAFILLIFY